MLLNSRSWLNFSYALVTSTYALRAAPWHCHCDIPLFTVV